MPDTDPHGATVPHTICTGSITELDATEATEADPWLNIGEAARYMHVSISSMRRYDTSIKGRPPVLPASRTPGGQRRWKRSQLDGWLANPSQAA